MQIDKITLQKKTPQKHPSKNRKDLNNEIEVILEELSLISPEQNVKKLERDWLSFTKGLTFKMYGKNF